MAGELDHAMYSTLLARVPRALAFVSVSTFDTAVRCMCARAWYCVCAPARVNVCSLFDFRLSPPLVALWYVFIAVVMDSALLVLALPESLVSLSHSFTSGVSHYSDSACLLHLQRSGASARFPGLLPARELCCIVTVLEATSPRQLSASRRSARLHIPQTGARGGTRTLRRAGLRRAGR